MALSFDPRWLSRYSTQDLAEDPQSPCVFCAIVNGEVEGHVIAETPDTLCFLDHLPATYGHTLVIPKQHCQDLFDISDESFQAVMATAKQVANALRVSCSAAGVNLVHASGLAAHQTVFHFHMHVVPRYDGDSIVVFPRLADPARKDEVAQRLRAALREELPPTGTAESSAP
ncbi:HIT family protein [Streptosporangium sandarakinum]|uniref:Histidine triad (HIT) family protein n=1 Tax=Streptosporangium sandarakinum TaxID=1260955 RepID=A0A852VBX9_9ACTN|nr:HIT family protein [Streptosporangium sandarakinum]NYF44564.1 histidine triad (HIT) family protein [Streptosporangium sandarakinum]